MNSRGGNLVTATIVSNSIVDQPFPANDLNQSKITSSKQSIEDLRLADEHKYQHQPVINRITSPIHQPPKYTTPLKDFPMREDTESELLPTSSQFESPYTSRYQRILSPITPASAIGLPSHYPGSVDHRNFLLEELQDFDDIFGRSSNNSIHQGEDEDYKGDLDKTDSSRIESALSNIENDLDGYDLDDDLHALSRSSPPIVTLQNKGSLSGLSSSSSSSCVEIPSSITISSLTKPPSLMESARTISADTSSTYSKSSNFHKSTSTRPTAISRKKQHRRSRNLALGSNEFQNAILEELEYNHH